MTTDIENELRELLRDKAGEAPVATPSAPPRVLRRGRVRQAWTVAGAGVLMLALIVGSVAGLTRILGDGRDDGEVGNGGYDVFERTATIEAFTVTSPSDWYLVNEWPLSLQTAVQVSSGASEPCVAAPGTNTQECPAGSETAELHPLPEGLPMIQLTNVDLGLDTNVCRDGLSTDGAALYLALDAERALGGIADPSVPPFSPGAGLPSEGDGPCGPGRYAHFTVNGEPFLAWIGLGSGVTAQDRATVETAFERMSAIEDWTPIPPDHVSPAYVIAGGATDQYGPWRIEVRPSGGNVEMTMIGTVGASQAGFAVPEHAIDWCCEGAANGVLFGAVQMGTSGVELQPDGGSVPIAGTIVPTPPTLVSGFDLFFIEGTEGLTGDVVAVGLGTGAPVAPSPSAPPAAATRGDEVQFSGEFGGDPWNVLVTGSFADGDACIQATIASETLGPICHDEEPNPLIGPDPSADSWTTADMNLFVTSVDPAVVELRFTSDDGPNVPSDFQCLMGPTGWTDPDRRVCVLPLPPQGSGTLEFLDADGTILFANGMGWGASEAGPIVPAAVEPVHGGTYWAVYPWIGPTGSDEGNQIVGRLFDEFGIQAFQGELGCDDGAAAALGSDAPHGVGVYFDTRVDAEAFATQVADAGIATDVPVARVTTYCLD